MFIHLESYLQMKHNRPILLAHVKILIRLIRYMIRPAYRIVNGQKVGETTDENRTAYYLSVRGILEPVRWQERMRSLRVTGMMMLNTFKSYSSRREMVLYLSDFLRLSGMSLKLFQYRYSTLPLLDSERESFARMYPHYKQVLYLLDVLVRILRPEAPCSPLHRQQVPTVEIQPHRKRRRINGLAALMVSSDHDLPRPLS